MTVLACLASFAVRGLTSPKSFKNLRPQSSRRKAAKDAKRAELATKQFWVGS
jgi:hypothetical protein